MGGIISGIFTATESAAIGALYAFIITFFVYRDISIIRFKGFFTGLLEHYRWLCF